MNEKEIYDRLLDKGFDVRTSAILAENLIMVNPKLRPILDTWLETGKESDFQAQGVSLKELMAKHEMQYQAALLTMDWIIQDPESALSALKKGIR